MTKLPQEHIAPPYNDKGEKLEKFWRGPNAAGSLHTTAGDYARVPESGGERARKAAPATALRRG